MDGINSLTNKIYSVYRHHRILFLQPGSSSIRPMVLLPAQLRGTSIILPYLNMPTRRLS